MASPVTPTQFQAVISDPTATLCGNFTNTLLKLPNLIYQLVNYMFDSSGNLTTVFQKAITDLTLRPGDLIFSAGLLDAGGRLLCDGSAVSRMTYANLFAAIGTMYGAGNTTTTFNLPDYRDRFPIGAGNKAIATTGGAATKTLALNNMPPHTHDCPAVGQGGGGGSGAELFQANEVTNVNQTDRTLVTNSAGGSGGPPAVPQPFDVMNPWIAAFIYVKT